MTWHRGRTERRTEGNVKCARWWVQPNWDIKILSCDVPFSFNDLSDRLDAWQNLNYEHELKLEREQRERKKTELTGPAYASNAYPPMTVPRLKSKSASVEWPALADFKLVSSSAEWMCIAIAAILQLSWVELSLVYVHEVNPILNRNSELI